MVAAGMGAAGAGGKEAPVKTRALSLARASRTGALPLKGSEVAQERDLERPSESVRRKTPPAPPRFGEEARLGEDDLRPHITLIN
jgi:hypothetical protein